jgi:RNA polymerase sigma factor (sigma-70 family)
MATSQLTKVLDHIRGIALRQEAARLTDKQLLERFIRRRDETAFEAIARRHGPMVMGVCRRVLRNRHDAEDAFQATFLVLVCKAASIASRQLLANWLYGVAFKTALKARAVNARRRRREALVTEMPEPHAVQQDLWSDVLPVLDAELSRLSEKYRAPIILCDLEGKTGKEAARLLGWPEGSLSGRLSRARALLAKRLTQRGLALPAGLLALWASEKTLCACVPVSLVVSTVKAAMLVAAGQGIGAGIVSANVAALSEGVLKAMLLTKLKTVTAGLILIAVVGVGAAQMPFRTAAAGEAQANNPFSQLPGIAIPLQAAKLGTGILPEYDSETELVEKLLIARRDYQRSLELLREHYIKKGDKEKAKWAEEELRDYHRINHQAFILDLDLPPTTLQATTNIWEANKLIARATEYKDKGTGMDYIDNQRRAELLLQQVLKQFPASNMVGEAAYLLGDLYESPAFMQYRRAALYFERCVQWDPQTQRDATSRAAQLRARLSIESPSVEGRGKNAENGSLKIEDFLLTALNRDHHIGDPSLHYKLQVKGVEGRTLIGPVFVLTDSKSNTKIITARAADAEISVDLANSQVLIHMNRCWISSTSTNTDGYFEKKVWPVNLTPELLRAALILDLPTVEGEARSTKKTGGIHTPDVQFRTDYNETRLEAEKKGLPIVIYCTTDSCSWCLRLERETFSDPSVAKCLNERFVPLKVAAREDPRLIEALRIRAFPTVILAGPNGKILLTLEGYQEADKFHDSLQHVLQGLFDKAPR